MAPAHTAICHYLYLLPSVNFKNAVLPDNLRSPIRMMCGQCCSVLAKNGFVTPSMTEGLKCRRYFSEICNLDIESILLNSGRILCNTRRETYTEVESCSHAQAFHFKLKHSLYHTSTNGVIRRIEIIAKRINETGI